MLSILMASYNGEKYIAEQIESVMQQTEQDFVLYINDDCSTDNTYHIASQYAQKRPDKIILTQNAKNTGNPKFNFIQMMIRRRDNYLMCCDQDDIWLPEKIATALAKMRDMEKKYGEATPLLVHTDLTVVDESLQLIAPSFKTMIGTAEIHELRELLLQNNVTGCTVIYNRALAEYLTRQPSDFVMHDWWLALVAMCFGKTGYIGEPMILYRQHSNNMMGAQNVKQLQSKFDRLSQPGKIHDNLYEFYRQCGSFLDTYNTLLSDEQRDLFSVVSQLPEKRKAQRIITFYRMRLFRKGFLRKASQILLG